MQFDERSHPDLFDASNQHRIDHGGECTVFPSPDAATWGAVAAAINAKRVLEVGCGIGYQAACLATVAPECSIDSIERDPIHVDIAESTLDRLGLGQRISVLRGDAESILPELDTQYDLVIEDAGLEYPEWLPNLGRLVSPRGVLIIRNLLNSYIVWSEFLPVDATVIVRPRSRN